MFVCLFVCLFFYRTHHDDFKPIQTQPPSPAQPHLIINGIVTSSSSSSSYYYYYYYYY